MTEYLVPSTVEEARKLGGQKGSAYLGGGTWLNSRPRGTITRLISLEALGLEGVRFEKEGIRIGAGTRFQDLLDTAGLPPALTEAVSDKASRTLRNMITLGGELALAEAESCVIPALIALDAKMVLAGEKEKMPVDELSNQVSAGLILEVRIPDEGKASVFRSVSRTSHSRKNLVCAVAARAEACVLRELRLVIGDCVTAPRRLTAVEDGLEGKSLPGREEIESLVRENFSPESDFHASGEYKKYMSGMIAADMLGEMAAGEARS
jgi:putative selenate reductase FAD-binding subunit